MDKKRIFDISKEKKNSALKEIMTIDPSSEDIPFQNREDQLEIDGLEHLYDRKTPPIEYQSR